MALIKCYECGAEISNKASCCPKCGAPVIVHSWRCSKCGNMISEEPCPYCNNAHKNAEPICPNCKTPFKPESNFCVKCGMPKQLNNSYSKPNVTSSLPGYGEYSSCMPNTQAASKEPKPRLLALGIIGWIFSIIGLFFFPIIFCVLGLIFGIITAASNPKEEKEGIKPIWKYKNKARAFGLAAISSSISAFLLNVIVGAIWGASLFSGIV